LLQHEVKRLAAMLRTRIALRQKRAKNGQMDPKATIRANLKYHGVPMEIKHKDRVRKPKIVVICDISTSMRFCSELMLSFLFALQGQVRKTHAFAFIDHLESISEDFSAANADEAIQSVLWRMPSGHYNTDLGWSLNDFQNEYMDTLNSGTTLIIVGDGRNNYYDPRLDIFSTMCRRASRTIWTPTEGGARHARRTDRSTASSDTSVGIVMASAASRAGTRWTSAGRRSGPGARSITRRSSGPHSVLPSRSASAASSSVERTAEPSPAGPSHSSGCVPCRKKSMLWITTPTGPGTGRRPEEVARSG